MSDIISILVEHSAEFAILDPALRKVGVEGAIIIKDWIGPERLKTVQEVFERAANKLKSRKAESSPPPLSIMVLLLEAAQDESRDELKDLWASLLAAAADPKRMGIFRRDFIGIAKQLEPIDAAILRLIEGMSGGYTPNRAKWVAQRLEVTEDQTLISFDKLRELSLVSSYPPNEHHPELQTLGRLFMRALKD